MKPRAQHTTPVLSFTKNIYNFNLVHNSWRQDPNNNFIILLMQQYLIYKDECLFVGMYVWNLHKFTFLNQSEPNFAHVSPWSGRDRKVCMDPKFLTSSTFWALLSLGATAESWAQDGCRRDRFLRYPYIRDSSWCSCDVTNMTSQMAQSSAAALYPWF
jgi:hypothetical protein